MSNINIQDRQDRPKVSLSIGLALSLLLLILCPFAHSKETTKEIVITIDDFPTAGPAPYTPATIARKLSDALKQKNAPATGFFIGQYQEPQNIEAVSIWASNGFDLGNHSWFHPHFSKTSSGEYISGIKNTEEFLEPYRLKFDVPFKAFRFPFLDQGDTPEKQTTINTFFETNEIYLGHVSVDTSDWAFADYYNTELKADRLHNLPKIQKLYFEHILDCLEYAEAASTALFDRIIPQIILLHASPMNADALPELLQRLSQHGYRFISLKQALNDSAYQPYKHRLVYQPADHFFYQWSKAHGKELNIGRDRTSYNYFKNYWEPLLKKEL